MSAPSPARQAAYEVLWRVFEDGAFADRALPGAVERFGLDARARALAQHLAYGAVQRRGSSDHAIARFSSRPLEEIDPPLLAALRLGAFELLFTGGTPDHAAVSEAVELAKRSTRRGGGRGGEGLVNAVLRKLANNRAALLAELADDSDPAHAALAHSCPSWLAEMWWEELGAELARSLLSAANDPPERAFRAGRIGADEAIGRLRAAGVEASPAGALGGIELPDAIVTEGATGDAGEAMVAAGELSPQSRASQLVVAMLDPRPDERILDLCAGPGIKSAQIASALEEGGELVAVDLDRARAGEISRTCTRLGVTQPRVLVADATSADLGNGYDRVLVDAPCSDLGTLAARPDARWRKDPATIERLASLQAAIVDRAAGALRPGGTLVYSTCTISRRENEDQIGRLLGEHDDLTADDLGGAHPALASSADTRFLQTLPSRDGTSGFFVARLRRTA